MPTSCKLVEDPHRLRSGVSRLFDAEGLPTKKREIVRDGVLNGWTLDLSSARKLGMELNSKRVQGSEFESFSVKLEYRA
jgi:PmbA protein